MCVPEITFNLNSQSYQEPLVEATPAAAQLLRHSDVCSPKRNQHSHVCSFGGVRNIVIRSIWIDFSLIKSADVVNVTETVTAFYVFDADTKKTWDYLWQRILHAKPLSYFLKGC